MASSVTHISATGSVMGRSSIVSGSHIYRETMEDRIKQWREWMLGSDDEGKKIIMGRSLLQWFLLIGGYLLFYVGLVVFFVVCMVLFYWYMGSNRDGWNFPMVRAPDSILETPGLSYRPQTRIDTTVLHFIKEDPLSYQTHIDQIAAYLNYYENQNQQGERFIDCNEIQERRVKDFDKVCRFDLSQMGEDCVFEQEYGFSNGQPCVLLKLNKVFDWIPEEYTEENVPDEIKDTWDQWWITVTCEGETAADKENLGELEIHPANGFAFKHFPFRNQQAYRSPLVMVQFLDTVPGFLLMVTCKAWAKNIVHDSNTMIGQVHFELLVD